MTRPSLNVTGMWAAVTVDPWSTHYITLRQEGNFEKNEIVIDCDMALALAEKLRSVVTFLKGEIP